MINKVEDTMDGGTVNNPMEAITKMMTSGVFSELVGNMTNGLQSGELNIGNLLGSVNDMVGTMNQGEGLNNPNPNPNPNPNKQEESGSPQKIKRNKKSKRPRRK